MFVPKEMKIHQFVDVAIPSNKDYFGRFGERAPLPDAYTGDDPAIMPLNKIDEISMYQKYANMKADEASAQKENE